MKKNSIPLHVKLLASLGMAQIKQMEIPKQRSNGILPKGFNLDPHLLIEKPKSTRTIKASTIITCAVLTIIILLPVLWLSSFSGLELKWPASGDDLMTQQALEIQQMLEKYPTPQRLQSAVDSGEVDYDSLQPYFTTGANYPAIHP